MLHAEAQWSPLWPASSSVYNTNAINAKYDCNKTYILYTFDCDHIVIVCVIVIIFWNLILYPNQ